MLNSLVGQNPMPLLMHVIQCKVSVRPGYVINQVRPDLLRQNVIQMTQPSFNPDPTVLFEYTNCNPFHHFTADQVSPYHDTYIYTVHLVMILIWWFGDFGFDRQI